MFVDKGSRSHKVPDPRRVFISGQKRGVHGQIKKELRRRSAIKPVIGHLKSDGHLEQSWLKWHHFNHAFCGKNKDIEHFH